jgi:glucose-6-phosphate dehydrogenase assembly protein OpcA
MSVGQIERELARLRMNKDGTLGARASVLNLVAVTDEDSAQDVGQVIHELSGHYPLRAILIISDPDEEEANLKIRLSAFCVERGGAGGNQVCAEQITVHAEGPPAEHLESLAGPLLIPDLPVFLWYPNGVIPRSPECDGMAALADRLVLDSGAADDCEAFLWGVANHLLEERGVPAIGDLRWAALSPWRSLVADLFASSDRAGELEKIRRVEILHHAAGECQALLLAGWLSSALDWHPESMEGTEEGSEFHFAGPSGDAAVELVPDAPGVPLRRVRLFSEEFTFQIQASRHGEHTDACSTVVHGDEPVGERTVHLRSSDAAILLGEELKLLGRDETYESAVGQAVRMLGS